MKAEVKQQVIDWLKHKDYEAGVVILSGVRPQMARIMGGREHRYKTKLEYELKKLIGEDHISKLAASKHVVEAKPKTVKQAMVKQVKTKKKPKPAKEPAPVAAPKAAEQPTPVKPEPKPAPKPETAEQPKPAPKAQKKPQAKKAAPEKPGYDLSKAYDPTEEVPPEIERIIKEHSRLFTLRSKLSEDRYVIPQTNSQQNMKRRRVLSASINELSDRIETLYEAHIAYKKTRQMPDMAVLFPARAKPAQAKATPEALKKERNSLMASNRRDRIHLDYQSPRKLDRKNPMPAGPKRNEIADRIKERQQRIKQIDKLLKK